jgi:hypothetical protein
MPRDGAIIFADLIGKLDVLYVRCPKTQPRSSLSGTAFNRGARTQRGARCPQFYPCVTQPQSYMHLRRDYEVVESKGSAKDQRPSRCVMCDREVFPPDRENVGQLHLVWRPDEDRE